MRLHTGNRKGQTAVLFTLAIVPLMGVVGLVVDIGWMYFRKQAAQTAADAAAAAAATAAYTTAGGGPTCSSPGVACTPAGQEITCPANPTNNPTNNIEVGCLYAKENGFVSSGRQKVTIQTGFGTPPTGTSITINYWIVVRVSEQIPQLFSSVLGFPAGNVTARSITGTREGSAGGCVLTLNPTAVSMILSGSVSLTSGCGVYVNSNNSAAITLNGGGRITTTGPARTQIVGGCSGCPNISPAAQTGAPTFSDPFADMIPPDPGACQSAVTLGSHDTATIGPGTYCGGWDLGAQSTLRLNPGIYYVRGNISLGGQTTLRGTGVMIFLENGGVSMAGGSTVDLTAPTSGYYQGVLFYQARGNTAPSTLVGGTGQLMNGVLYFPSAPLTYTGGSSTQATQTTIVANTLSMVGNSYISAASNTMFTGTTGGAYIID